MKCHAPVFWDDTLAQALNSVVQLPDQVPQGLARTGSIKKKKKKVQLLAKG